jgi:Tfp pilus assembly protein PilF
LRQPTPSHYDEVLTNGISAAQAGNRAQARILLQYAVEIDPKSEAGWLWLASISEYPEELLVFLDHVLAINSKNSRAVEWKNATRQLMAKTFVQRGIDAANEERNAEAVSCFDTALSYDEHNQLAWFWKDSLSKVNTETDEEAVVEQESHVPQPTTRDADAIFSEAESALAAGNRLQALALVNEAIEFDQESEKCWALRSHLVDDFDEKRRSLEHVVKINPENQTARAALDTLLAMVEMVSHDPDMEEVSVTEPSSKSPFEEYAHPITNVVHENSPTQELELPESIRQHNPFESNDSFVSKDSYELSATYGHQTSKRATAFLKLTETPRSMITRPSRSGPIIMLRPTWDLTTRKRRVR